MAKKSAITPVKARSATELVSASAQTFRLRAPESAKVLLAGDFTNWQEEPIPMKRAVEGVWETAIPLAPGTYQYRFIADGEWRDDPDCVLNAPNQFGGHNAVRVVA
jgi:1,4-alpha-glucan branching enzyme